MAKLKKSLDEKHFRDLLTIHLLPMFSGAYLEEKTVVSDETHALVAYGLNQHYLLLKPFKNATYRVELHRSQKISPQEKALIERFINELEKIVNYFGTDHFNDLMTVLPRRMIGRFLAEKTERRDTLEESIQWFESLASQTYEGKAIVATLGITKSHDHGPITISSLRLEDFSKVLSNGFDTIYECGEDGKVFNLVRLPIKLPESHAPIRMGAIANWTDQDRISLVLNRGGEVLVFKNKMLQFAKRAGAWRYYSHNSALKQFGRGISSAIKNAIYESCIDTSFSRNGGCIAWLTRDGERKLRQKGILNSKDIIENRETTRTKLLAKAINKKPFQDLDRLLRQEFLAMDGATILNNRGNVITSGAIIEVPSGSAGGGRRAAALNLSKWGIGIKISADGPITGFRNSKEIFSL